jgi:short-subunit dehydrogenase
MRDSVAIITGASSGIGRATALALARRGLRLALTARNRAGLEAIESDIRTQGGSVFIQPTDVTDRAQTDAFVAETLHRFGRIDIAVCNAGQYVQGAVAQLTVGDFERAMAVNFYGALHVIFAVLPHMLARRSGHIVAVSSVDGKKGLPLDAAYVASKFALNGFMDVLRQELHGTGVYASTILPGRVDTPMIDHLSVPSVSAKIPSARVAGAIIRAIRRRKAEVIVPFVGPASLILINALSPATADWLVRVLRLEGKRTPGQA